MGNCVCKPKKTSVRRKSAVVAPLATIAYSRWHHLPDHLLRAVFSRLTVTADFLAVSQVCRSWSKSLSALTSSESPLFAVLPSFPASTATFYSLTTSKAFRLPFPAFQTSRLSIRQSHGHLIMPIENHSKTPCIINMLTGSKTVFPAAPSVFRFRILSAPRTAPGCMLLLFSEKKMFSLLIGEDQWVAHRYPQPQLPSNEKVQNAIVINDNNNVVYAITTQGRIMEIEFGYQRKRSRLVSIPYGPFRGRVSDVMLGSWNKKLLVMLTEEGRHRTFVVDSELTEWFEEGSLDGKVVLKSEFGCDFVEAEQWDGFQRNRVYSTFSCSSSYFVLSLDGRKIDLVKHSERGQKDMEVVCPAFLVCSTCPKIEQVED